MTKNIQHFHLMGKIGTAYGVKGWLKIQAFTEWQADIFNYQPWYFSKDGQKDWVKMDPAESKAHGQGFIVKFPGIDTPEAARLLTGRMIGIPRDQLPLLKQNEYYWADLEGLTVIDQHGKNLGKIRHIMQTGTHDILVIKRDHEKEWALPYLPGKVIKKVDLDAKEIHIDWEG